MTLRYGSVVKRGPSLTCMVQMLGLHKSFGYAYVHYETE